MVAATIHPAALEELAQATAFYEGRAPGLGREFFEEVQRVLVVIRRRRVPSRPIRTWSGLGYEVAFELPRAEPLLDEAEVTAR